MTHKPGEHFNTKHGAAINGDLTGEYRSWRAMKRRCNPKIGKDRNNRWENYVGRGIKVCERWMSFENFREDMGSRPEGHSIERRDNSKDYCKENCYWATPKQQSNNRRSNRVFECFGKRLTIAEWGAETGISQYSLWYRLCKAKWPIHKALTKKIRVSIGGKYV